MKNRIFLGEQTEYLVETDDFGEILVHASKQSEGLSGGFAPGDAVTIGWDEKSALTFEDELNREHTSVGAPQKNTHDGTATLGD